MKTLCTFDGQTIPAPKREPSRKAQASSHRSNRLQYLLTLASGWRMRSSPATAAGRRQTSSGGSPGEEMLLLLRREKKGASRGGWVIMLGSPPGQFALEVIIATSKWYERPRGKTRRRLERLDIRARSWEALPGDEGRLRRPRHPVSGS